STLRTRFIHSRHASVACLASVLLLEKLKNPCGRLSYTFKLTGFPRDLSFFANVTESSSNAIFSNQLVHWQRFTFITYKFYSINIHIITDFNSSNQFIYNSILFGTLFLTIPSRIACDMSRTDTGAGPAK
ncbi:hypothetical protein MAR_021018, partial [Mya arenaria]